MFISFPVNLQSAPMKFALPLLTALLLAPLARLHADGIPQSIAEIWSGFDPRKDALETEMIRQWEEDGSVMRYVRFVVGTFEGKKVRMAAYYGFSEGGRNFRQSSTCTVAVSRRARAKCFIGIRRATPRFRPIEARSESRNRRIRTRTGRGSRRGFSLRNITTTFHPPKARSIPCRIRSTAVGHSCPWRHAAS